ncbi:AIR synthase family protein [Halothermothrix orenii]|uniref:AIR synthase related protein domain protein n=1 Tax=Halothermothrix orenii (strain H 168 / OCM 544 / DSM 9562) TaxID=373903 RepID=B8D020_HALOH|nr:AIR synthase family protein [Halothermothrix orenii]ACL70872.1 AIR synthase related protein domain protein [Halothermothrix orenii H 168]
MKIGKIPKNKLESLIINKIKYHHKDVLVHSGIGEDSAVVDFGDEVLVISSDPITGAVNKAGYLAVHVACNDLASCGARPVGIQVVLLLPPATEEIMVGNIMEEITRAAASIEVEVIGGHTEILSKVTEPIITVTAIGKAPRDKYITTGGARPGDELIITKGLGIEGTFILASDYAELLKDRGVPPEIIERGQEYISKLSVLEEGLIGAGLGVHAMHDITEGGLYGALDEMVTASKAGFRIKRSQFPVNPETDIICKALDLDPAGLISSGSMLIAAPDGGKLVDKLARAGIKASIIGEITEEGCLIEDENGEFEELSGEIKDELWSFMEKINILLDGCLKFQYNITIRI